MALFTITPDLQNSVKPITPGWVTLRVTKMEDKPGSDGSLVTVFSHKVIDDTTGGKDKDKMVFNRVDHGENLKYNVPYLDFLTKGTFSKPVSKDTPVTLTVENLPVKEFDAEIINKTVDGRILDNIKQFRPAGTMVKAGKLVGNPTQKQ